ncbi:helix-turn-helix domain-containing protein [Limibacter armeniacum]|uniref:helix-turn-helix domain-containing protein n=1 Tax=Limibacter armeniacum TaxID=466084 RepID=UPI002FE5E2D2
MSQLNFSQRQQIETLLAKGFSQTEIAQQLGVHKATVSREISRNKLADGKYSASMAEQKKEIRRYVANQNQKGRCKDIHLTHKYPKLVRQKREKQYHSPMLAFFATLPAARQGLPNFRFRVELRTGRWEIRGYRSMKCLSINNRLCSGKSRLATNKISVIKRFYRKLSQHPFAGRQHKIYWMDYRYKLQAFQYYGMKIICRKPITQPYFLHEKIRTAVSMIETCAAEPELKNIA